MIRSFLPARPLAALALALLPLGAWAEAAEASGFTFDRIITIVSSIVVPILLALLGHHLGEARTKKEEEKVRAKSVFIPPPRPKTALNWLAEVGNVAAPTSQLIAPSSNRRKWMPFAVAGLLIGAGAITGVLVSRLVSSPAGASAAGPAAAGQAGGSTVSFKMFVDRGQHFVRAGTAEGLEMGESVQLLDPKGALAGEGVVIEAWEHVARLNVSPAQPAGAVLRASFIGGAAAAAPVAAVEADPVAAAPAVRPPKPAVAAAPVARTAKPTPVAAAPSAGLKGEVSIGGIGPAKRLRIANNGSTPWTRCELRLPNNKRYRLESLAAGASDGIMMIKFSQDGVELDAELTWVNVTCAEGTARMNVR